MQISFNEILPMLEIYQLNKELWFPEPHLALEEPNGLLALGGDLSSERLLLAYSQGIFPWSSDNEPLLWWSPAPRMVLFPQEIKISRSLAKTLRQNKFTYSFNHNFAAVIQACAELRAQAEGTWITTAMQQAYIDLHHQGFAHSVEVWLEGKLVGGLYGLALGGVFFGESMFSTVSDASKVALVKLSEHLQARGFSLVDCQVYTAHLASLGAREISRTEFTEHLRQATPAAITFT